MIAAIPEREDPQDALVGKPLRALAFGARVGTSSGRRAAQLRGLRRDLVIEPVRGNVDTRLRKLEAGEYDAIVLAAAGLRRLGMESKIAQILTPAQMCPAAGQGALAIQTRADDHAFFVCRTINHQPSFQAVTCERAALARLGGGCQLPVGAFAEFVNERLRLTAVVVAPDGSEYLNESGEASGDTAQELGEAVAKRLLERGAGAILARLT